MDSSQKRVYSERTEGLAKISGNNLLLTGLLLDSHLSRSSPSYISKWEGANVCINGGGGAHLLRIHKRGIDEIRD